MINYAPTAFAREMAARIRGYVARYDVAQADLAVLCDVSQSQFSKILRGVRPMTVDQMTVICEALGVDASELVSEVWMFIRERDAMSSPVVFVEEGERLDTPYHWQASILDAWGQAARTRLNVGGATEDDNHAADLREDFDLAASDDASAVDPNREP